MGHRLVVASSIRGIADTWVQSGTSLEARGGQQVANYSGYGWLNQALLLAQRPEVGLQVMIDGSHVTGIPRFDRPECMWATFGHTGEFGVCSLHLYDVVNEKYASSFHPQGGGMYNSALVVNLFNHAYEAVRCFAGVYYTRYVASPEFVVPDMPAGEVDVAAYRAELAEQLGLSLDDLGVGWSATGLSGKLFVTLNNHEPDKRDALQALMVERFGSEQIKLVGP